MEPLSNQKLNPNRLDSNSRMELIWVLVSYWIGNSTTFKPNSISKIQIALNSQFRNGIILIWLQEKEEDLLIPYVKELYFAFLTFSKQTHKWSISNGENFSGGGGGE